MTEEEKSPWTPVGSPERVVHTERDALLNRLDSLGVRLAGAELAETNEIRDIVQWQEERAVEDRAAARQRPANQKSDVPQEEISRGLREVSEFRRRRQSASPRKYY